MRAHYRVTRGRVTRFTVQLEVLAEGQWQPVVRYDSSHRFAHCDLYRPGGQVITRDLKITVEEAAVLFEAGGVPRNKRSIRRYCKRGDLTTCVAVDTEHGRQWMIDQAEVETYIIQLEQIRDQSTRSRPAMSGHDRRTPALAGDDHLAEAAAASEMTTFLKNQIEEKDKQINALLERDRETNILIQGLQRMVLALKAPESDANLFDHNQSHQHPAANENADAEASGMTEAEQREGDN